MAKKVRLFGLKPEQLLGLLPQLGPVIGVGDGDELLSPLSLRLTQEAGDAIFGDDEVGIAAGYGRHDALLQKGNDAGYGATDSG